MIASDMSKNGAMTTHTMAALNSRLVIRDREKWGRIGLALMKRPARTMRAVSSRHFAQSRRCEPVQELKLGSTERKAEKYEI